jgi:hypothetical protein
VRRSASGSRCTATSMPARSARASPMARARSRVSWTAARHVGSPRT